LTNWCSGFQNFVTTIQNDGIAYLIVFEILHPLTDKSLEIIHSLTIWKRGCLNRLWLFCRVFKIPESLYSIPECI